jgi:hypothetical protein
LKDEEKREFDPMVGTFPDKNKIICKDCVYRDRTVVDLGGKKLPVGITKSFCEIFLPPPKTNGKPTEVLFHGGDCKYYKQE